MLLIVANLLAAADGGEIFVDKGACPGEGCAYGESWITRSNVTLRAEPSRSATIVAKLDAGTDAHFRRIDRSRVSFERILENLLTTGRMRPLVIQSMFVRLFDAGPSPEEITAWANRLKQLSADGCRIDRVQVYTCARRTAVAQALALEPAALEAIAEQARALGLSVEVFASPA